MFEKKQGIRKRLLRALTCFRSLNQMSVNLMQTGVLSCQQVARCVAQRGCVPSPVKQTPKRVSYSACLPASVAHACYPITKEVETTAGLGVQGHLCQVLIEFKSRLNYLRHHVSKPKTTQAQATKQHGNKHETKLLSWQLPCSASNSACRYDSKV